MRCAVCDHPLRPHHTTVAEYPGTVTHHSYGRCGGCRWREENGKTGPAQHGGRVSPPEWDVDEVAVLLAIRGESVRLNPAERRDAVEQLTRRGESTAYIARLLRCSTRQVTRIRTRLKRAGERQAELDTVGSRS